MRKQYKSSKIKNKKITKKKIMEVPLKARYPLKFFFRFGARNEKQYCGNIQ